LQALMALKHGKTGQALKYVEEMAKVARPKYITELAQDARFKPLGEEQKFWEVVFAARHAQQQQMRGAGGGK
ncbi:MAG: hypothetical protein P8Z49_02995, partial [Acidobacteriota bacterium]